jgi:hypothetical protein
LEKAEEAMRHEKSLNRYREEQNMSESDMNLSGFVRFNSSYLSLSLIEILFSSGDSSLCKYVYKMWYEYRSNESI